MLKPRALICVCDWTRRSSSQRLLRWCHINLLRRLWASSLVTNICWFCPSLLVSLCSLESASSCRCLSLSLSLPCSLSSSSSLKCVRSADEGRVGTVRRWCSGVWTSPGVSHGAGAGPSSVLVCSRPDTKAVPYCYYYIRHKSWCGRRGGTLGFHVCVRVGLQYRITLIIPEQIDSCWTLSGQFGLELRLGIRMTSW